MVLSVLAITAKMLPDMRRAGWGPVMTMTSSGVVSSIPNLAISNALRLSLVEWSKTPCNRECRRPERTSTDRIHFLDKAKAEREDSAVKTMQNESISVTPTGRYGTVEEFADLVTFLASDRISYVSGSMICVDSGLIPGI